MDVSAVEKYTMPEEKYEELTDTVLSWKKRQQLGRFDPNKPNVEAEKLKKFQDEVDARGIASGKRCRVGGADLDRRGTVRYVGPVEQIPGEGLWVGMWSSILPSPLHLKLECFATEPSPRPCLQPFPLRSS